MGSSSHFTQLIDISLKKNCTMVCLSNLYVRHFVKHLLINFLLFLVISRYVSVFSHLAVGDHYCILYNKIIILILIWLQLMIFLLSVWDCDFIFSRQAWISHGYFCLHLTNARWSFFVIQHILLWCSTHPYRLSSSQSISH